MASLVFYNIFQFTGELAEARVEEMIKNYDLVLLAESSFDYYAKDAIKSSEVPAKLARADGVLDYNLISAIYKNNWEYVDIGDKYKVQSICNGDGDRRGLRMKEKNINITVGCFHLSGGRNVDLEIEEYIKAGQWGEIEKLAKRRDEGIYKAIDDGNDIIIGDFNMVFEEYAEHPKYVSKMSEYLLGGNKVKLKEYTKRWSGKLREYLIGNGYKMMLLNSETGKKDEDKITNPRNNSIVDYAWVKEGLLKTYDITATILDSENYKLSKLIKGDFNYVSDHYPIELVLRQKLNTTNLAVKLTQLNTLAKSLSNINMSEMTTEHLKVFNVFILNMMFKNILELYISTTTGKNPGDVDNNPVYKLHNFAKRNFEYYSVNVDGSFKLNHVTGPTAAIPSSGSQQLTGQFSLDKIHGPDDEFYVKCIQFFSDDVVKNLKIDAEPPKMVSNTGQIQKISLALFDSRSPDRTVNPIIYMFVMCFGSKPDNFIKLDKIFGGSYSKIEFEDAFICAKDINNSWPSVVGYNTNTHNIEPEKRDKITHTIKQFYYAIYYSDIRYLTALN